MLRAASSNPGPDYNLVRRFYSHAPAGTPAGARFECFSVCEYCGDLVPHGIAGVVCCHERAVRHGAPLPEPARSEWVDRVWMLFLIAATLFIIWKGVSQ